MSNCERNDLGAFEVSLGVFITTFLVVSYMPQIFKLIKTKNSYGISPYAQMLSFTAQTLTLFNIFLLQQEIFDCCIIGKYKILYCLGKLIGFIQVFIQWGCITTIVFLFIRYYPCNRNQEYTAIGTQGEILIKEWKVIVRIIYFLIGLMIVIITLTLDAIFMNWDTESIIYLAGVYGVSSSVFSLIQFLPQIRKTFVEKSVGALSIPSMLIQCPGSFILVLFLAIQPGTNWTTWITYFAGGTLQGILLILCIYYNLKNGNNNYVNYETEPESEPEHDIEIEKENENEHEHNRDLDIDIDVENNNDDNKDIDKNQNVHDADLI
ncbi:hypothetical protein BCR32DRAFT_217141 [Anaeromyces robustus]|uniref:PQ-loop-domain-containing protein n=1 Tax=Anaeromyces robustus TaxID=1754192 RepID=A0A1Y1XIW8_9FUNG|nr:hypothetical protein BCR32DRAFT_217141 [Anaeromyces robustus]|eukprot:ORX85336.1 hypothetical protein BCR32DRAFT_217141 [Anaeromyces robustus]